MNEFEQYKQIGLYAQKIKSEVYTYLKNKPIVTDLQIVELIETKIKEKYNLAFPALIGFRNIITHNTALPLSNNIINSKIEILRIDFGINKNGFLIDNAYTYNLCEDEEVQKLLDLYSIFFKEVEKLKAGDKYNMIGLLVEKCILSKGNYSLLSFLCGHGISKNCIHSQPQYIYNFYDKNFKDIIQQDDVFCIEPFISIDSLKIKLTEGNLFKKEIVCCERWGYTKENSEIYEVIESKKSARVIHIEHQFYVTKQGCYKLT